MTHLTTDPRRADAPQVFGSNVGKFRWTEEAVDRLAALWADGRSASEIARIFGAGVTRNSVIGKVHRLGLSGNHRIMDARAASEAKRQVRLKRLRAARREAKKKEQRETKARMPRRKRVQDKVKLLRREWADEPQGGTSFLDLRPNQCHWPLDERDEVTWKFCGEKVERDGARYCAHHACRAYRCEVVEKEAA